MLGDKVQQKVKRTLEIVDFECQFRQSSTCQKRTGDPPVRIVLSLYPRHLKKTTELVKNHLHFKNGFVKIIVVTLTQEGGAADGKL